MWVFDFRESIFQQTSGSWYYTKPKINTYMVREHHVAVLSANHVSVLCMGLCVSSGSHAQYTYIIGPGAQPRAVQFHIAE